jgi:glycosyltransferase involved in cell wall biosynthesis
MGDSPSDFSIVLPVRNEAGNIAPMAAALKSIMAKLGSVEIIFVDDGSSDGTLATLRAAAADPAIRYVSFTRNFGHQAADVRSSLWTLTSSILPS